MKKSYTLPDKMVRDIAEIAKKRELTEDELVELSLKRELKLK